ncbi:Uncharacterised protein [Pluralibacter gergoviae]|nr:Uncharacterised protein [Pluralibacter gergoviae]
MHEFCIQVINPNTSAAMTQTIADAARAVAAPRYRYPCQLPDPGRGVH